MVMASDYKVTRRLPFKQSDFKDDDGNVDKMAYWRYLITSLKMTVGLMVITGNLRAGKTMFAWMVSWYRKEIFGIPCTADRQPKKAFGEYSLFTYDSLIKELDKIDKISESGTEWKDTSDLLLYKHTIWLDEAYKYFPRRRPMSTLGITLGDVIKQLFHYKSLMILAAPSIDELDLTLVDNYINVEVHAMKSITKPDTCLYRIYNRNEMIEQRLEIYGPNYYPLFNSTNPIGKRMKIKKSDYSF